MPNMTNTLASNRPTRQTKSEVAVNSLAAHPQTERWLDNHKVAWRLVQIKASDIDIEASKRNQARAGDPLLLNKIDEYRQAIDNGEVLPALVCWQKGQKYVLVDGNNRLAAHLLRKESYVDAYVLEDVTPELIMVLTYTANVSHGVPLSIEARQRHAIDLLKTTGRTQEWVADELHVPLSAVRSAVQLDRADERCVAKSPGRFSKKQWFTLGQSSRRRLGSVATDEGFVALTKFVLTARATDTEVSDLVTDINKTRSAQGQVTFVKDCEQLPNWKRRTGKTVLSTSNGKTNGKTPHIAGSVRRGQYERVLGALNTLERLNVSEVAISANLAGDRELADRCLVVVGNLRLLAEKTQRVNSGA